MDLSVSAIGRPCRCGLAQLRTQRARPCRGSPTKVSALFGFGGESAEEKRRKAIREENWAAQQEILARRKSGSWQKDVQERRAEVRKYSSDPAYKKKIDDERRAKALLEEEEDPEVSIFNIIIPMAPFGMPKYDNGERFDLRLPYVDNGWVDEDADFGKQVQRFFGFGKKKDEAGPSEMKATKEKK